MQLKFKIVCLITTLLFTNMAHASTLDQTLTTDIQKSEHIIINSNTVFKQQFANAFDKFKNLNVKIAHDDFRELILSNSQNDFYLLLIAEKTAELGFFDLSTFAFGKINDLNISDLSIDDIKRYYYPKCQLEKNDIIMLAEIYSNIVYNDQVKESIEELLKSPRLLRDYDYANYLIALAYYNLKDNDIASKYIGIAIKNNPENINYKILQAKILADKKKGKISKKILSNIYSKKIRILSLSKKIDSSVEYVKYLSAQDTTDKDLYLGKFYFSEEDYSKSIRILQGAVSKNKKKNAILYGILSRCYFAQKDYNKAFEYANKSCKISRNSGEAYITLGDIETKNGNYKLAIKFYKSALANTDNSQEVLEKIANVYSKMSMPKKSDDLYIALMKEYKNSYIACYNIAIKNNLIDDIKKSISINIKFQDAWIDLARIMLERGNIELAKNYLTIANYLDDTNFRYYYYQSLLNKKESEINNYKSITGNENGLGNEV